MLYACAARSRGLAYALRVYKHACKARTDTMMATQQNALKTERKQPRGKPRSGKDVRTRASPPKPAPAAKLFDDSELSGSECPSPEQQRMSDKPGPLIDWEVSECFQRVGDMRHPLKESMVDLVVDRLSDMQRPLSGSEVEQLSEAFGVKTTEDFCDFVRNRFPADCRFLKFNCPQINGSIKEETSIRTQWRRVELTKTNQAAREEAEKHHAAKVQRWTKDVKRALENTQSQREREKAANDICAGFDMPHNSMLWLTDAELWYTIDIHHDENLQRAQDMLKDTLERGDVSRTTRILVLQALCKSLEAGHSALQAYTFDDKWGGIDLGNPSCDFMQDYKKLHDIYMEIHADPNHPSNRFWQQVKEAKQNMHDRIQLALSCVYELRNAQSTYAERLPVLFRLAKALGFQKNMLRKFADDTEWKNIQINDDASEFKQAYNDFLAQCKKKQERALENFNKAMQRRDEIVQIRRKALLHLARVGSVHTDPPALFACALDDTFETYDPAVPGDFITTILDKLRDVGKSTVGGNFIGK